EPLRHVRAQARRLRARRGGLPPGLVGGDGGDARRWRDDRPSPRHRPPARAVARARAGRRLPGAAGDQACARSGGTPEAGRAAAGQVSTERDPHEGYPHESYPTVSASGTAGVVRPARRPADWRPPGPPPARPTARLELWPRAGEDLCHLAGDWRILQLV